MTRATKKSRPLPFLHMLVMLVIAVWWATYFWQHTPSRELFHLGRPTLQQEAHVARRPALMPKLGYLSGSQGSRLTLAIRAAMGDILCGAGVLLLVGLASGIYIRRLDTWLGARTSGQAVAFRGQGLTAATLEENAKKQRGVLR